MNPALSSVICTYNNASLLCQTLEPLELQRHPNPSDSEVVVVANRCTDNTSDVVESFFSRRLIPNLCLIHEQQQGQGYARLRRMVDCSAARWIASKDDDNYVNPYWVAEGIRFAKDHPDCGAWGGLVEIFWEVNPPQIFNLENWNLLLDLHISGMTLVSNKIAA